MPTPTLSPVDAFLIASDAAEVGVPLIDQELLQELLASVGNVTTNAADDKLTFALRRARSTLANYAPWADTAHKYLSDRATRFALSLPARPKDAPGYAGWLPAVLASGRKAAGATADPSTVAAFEAGVAAGEVYFALWTGKYLAQLRTALPRK